MILLIRCVDIISERIFLKLFDWSTLTRDTWNYIWSDVPWLLLAPPVMALPQYQILHFHTRLSTSISDPPLKYQTLYLIIRFSISISDPPLLFETL